MSAAASAQPKTRRILIVEDDEPILCALAAGLADSGYEVDGVRDGQSAIDRLRATAFDLVVLDLRMPVVDGWQFRTLQRADPAVASVPVLAISADASAKAAAIDAAHFLKKPFRIGDLLDAVEQVLAAHDQARLMERLAEAERLAAIGLLAAGAAHEISNPLAFTVMSLDLMPKPLAAARAVVDRLEGNERAELARALDEVDDMIEDARVGADRVTRVVRSLQNLARREDGGYRPIDLRAILETAIAVTWNEIRFRARLVKELADVPWVRGSERRLAQLFTNLLMNAAQAIDEGAPGENEIRVVLRAAEGAVVAEVHDTGPGISVEARARLFEPFYTTKPAGRGTGLGLSICQSVVMEHGGTIEVESGSGRGTVFRIVLPCRPLPPADL